MNRPFRGKSHDNEGKIEGEWIYGFLAAPDQIMVWNEDNATGDMFQVSPETVGQFTGLLDKNGKEIYESDILATPDEQRQVPDVVVKFGDTYDVMPDAGYYGWYCEYVHEVNNTRACQLNAAIRHTSEVIGNIHENPELLKD